MPKIFLPDKLRSALSEASSIKKIRSIFNSFFDLPLIDEKFHFLILDEIAFAYRRLSESR